MDQELKAYLDEQFDGLKEESRHTRVLIEDMGDKIRLIAEGLVGVRKPSSFWETFDAD